MNQNDQIKKWIRTWDSARAALNENKRKELQDEQYYEKNRALLDHMLCYAYEHRTVRLTSGLVEQQYWFKRYYEKLNALK